MKTTAPSHLSKLFNLLITGMLMSLHCHAGVETRPTFSHFQYEGMDAVFELPLPQGSYRNPIMAGFYPDPSICRVGDTYYLIHSSFSYFPGIPVFESKDLVNWQQIGHVMDRSTQLDTGGLRLSEGIFAPAISYHDGLFYVVCTQVGGKGNFYVTAENPAGPWSDPVWLPEVNGIDPSLFFDDDGRVYLVHNGEPPNGVSQYQGHRAIYLWELDVQQGKTIAGPFLLVDGGVDIEKEPIWIEGPHLYKKDGMYYLMCAEGGTGPQHSEVMFRSAALDQPFEPLLTPILTQRDLDPKRLDAVQCTGHADLVETPEGDWWAVFLGTRPYQTDFYNTGRETFMLPVIWDEAGWPTILPAGERVPFVVKAPAMSQGLDEKARSFNGSGNFTWVDDFTTPDLKPEWLYARTPDQPVFVAEDEGGIRLIPSNRDLSSKTCPTYIARRQQHTHFEACASLQLATLQPGVIAGLAVYQSETSWLFLGVRKKDNGEVLVSVEKMDRDQRQLRQTVSLGAGKSLQDLQLWVRENAGLMDLWVENSGGKTTTVLTAMDSKFLSTAVAGGFVGCTVGLYSRTE